LTKSTLKNYNLTQNYNFFHLKSKLTSKSIFFAIKPFINSIKPSIKFNGVYKHLILDFSSSNWIFFINRAFISQRYTVKFQSLYFLASSTNFLLFSRRFEILFSLLLFFWYILIDFFSFLLFCAGTQKWVTTLV